MANPQQILKLKKLGMTEKEILMFFEQQKFNENVRIQKGEKGDKPTDEELLSLIKPLIPEVKDGKTPSKKELLDIIKPLIPQRDKIIADIIKRLPKPKDGKDGRDGKDGKDGEDFSPSLSEMAINTVNVLETFEGDERLDAKAIKNIEKNIDTRLLNLRDVKLDASQIKNLPESRVINKGGSDGFNVLEDNIIKKQGATQINFGSGFDVSQTTNGVDLTLDLDEIIAQAFTLQEVTDNGATTTNLISAGGLNDTSLTTGYFPYDNGTQLADSPIFTDGTNVGIGTSTLTAQLQITEDFEIPTTTDSTTGVITQNGNRFLHTYGDDNLFLGQDSGNFTVTGSKNIGIGKNAVDAVTSGSSNVGIGWASLSSVTEGSNNFAIGRNSLLLTTTASNNVGIGNFSLDANTTGFSNTGIGNNSLGANIDGIRNTAIGNSAGLNQTTGGDNTFIGSASGQVNLTGSQNTLLGSQAETQGTADQNSIVIGYNAVGIGSNTVVIGNDSITDTILKGDVGIGTASPSGKLHVDGDIYLKTGSKLIDPTNTAKFWQFEDGSGFNKIQAFSGLRVADWNGSTYANRIQFSSNQDSYINVGDLGIGVTSPSARLHSLSTTEQLRLSYDASNYTSFTVSSIGDLDISPVGDTVKVSASQDLQEFKFVAQNSFGGAGLQTSAIEVWGENKARFIGRNDDGTTARFNMGWDANANASGWGYGDNAVAVMVDSSQRIYLGNSLSTSQKYYGQQTISASSASYVSSVITRRFSSTEDLQQFMDENDNILTVVDSEGKIGVGTATPSSTLHNEGSLTQKIQRNTTTATIDDTAYQWNGNTDSAGFTYTLPAGVQGRTYKIVNTGTSGNVLTIAPNGSEKLIGVNSNFTLNDGESLIISYDATDGWY